MNKIPIKFEEIEKVFKIHDECLSDKMLIVQPPLK